jgi:tripartite-type tricarboxylate transporter receptor subunit TctC
VGKLDLLFDSLPTGLPHVRDGRLRALGVTSAQRSALAPEEVRAKLAHLGIEP